ncbi:hypothetical protein [Streptomyces nigrescens]|uniref:hypothetical protein n=1 Tax=Streptomyces nigrescens TaxID=1920 RepID=UPI0036FFBE35
MNDPTALVTLRTGVEVPRILIGTVGVTLGRLRENQPIALYELAKLAQDPDHQLFGNTSQVLRGIGMVDPDGSLNGLTRDIVRAFVELDGGDFRLVHPLG